MRKVIQWTVVPVAALAVAVVGCGKSGSKSTAMNADLKRDLKLASATQNLRINPDEVAPQSHQELAVRPKRAAGPLVVRTQHPTVKASTKAEQVAQIKADIPQVQVMASAAAPSESPSTTDAAPPLARPTAMPAAGYPASDRIPSAGSSGSGGILGGIFGAVLRGGTIDDDHCDPRGATRGRTIGADVYGTGAQSGGIRGGIFGSGGGIPMGRRR